MKTMKNNGLALIAVIVFGTLAATAGVGLFDSLRSGDITSLRISLVPWNAKLGFETEIAGDDPRLVPLIELLHRAEPCRGHKCPNAGAIRFLMKDGSAIELGLLPSHTSGEYNLRLYDGDRVASVYLVQRAELLDALEELGVPRDDPAFRE